MNRRLMDEIARQNALVLARQQAARQAITFDENLSGNELLARPMSGRRAGGQQQPDIVVPLPSGETVALVVSGRNGGLIEFADFAPGHEPSGFPSLTLPATQALTSVGGNYGVEFHNVEVVGRAGGQFQVLKDGNPIKTPVGGSRGKRLEHLMIETGSLPVGTFLSVSADTDLEAGGIVSFYTIEPRWQIATNLPSVALPDLGNAIGWWMADQIEGVADAAVVDQWDDQSGHNRHLERGPLGPILQEDTLGGLPTCHFGDAATRRTAAASIAGHIKPFTYYALVRLDSLPGSDRVIVGRRQSQSGSHGDNLLHAGTTIRTWNSTGSVVSGAGEAQTGWHIWTWQSTGAGRTIWRDGIQVASGGATSAGLNGIRFGDNTTPSGAPIDGAIAEVAIFGEAHDATQRATFHAYLTDKWSL